MEKIPTSSSIDEKGTGVFPRAQIQKTFVLPWNASCEEKGVTWQTYPIGLSRESEHYCLQTLSPPRRLAAGTDFSVASSQRVDCPSQPPASCAASCSLLPAARWTKRDRIQLQLKRKADSERSVFIQKLMLLLRRKKRRRRQRSSPRNHLQNHPAVPRMASRLKPQETLNT